MSTPISRAVKIRGRRVWRALLGREVGALHSVGATSATVYDHRSDHWRPPVTIEGGSCYAVITPEGELLVEIRDPS